MCTVLIKKPLLETPRTVFIPRIANKRILLTMLKRDVITGILEILRISKITVFCSLAFALSWNRHRSPPEKNRILRE